MHGGEGCRSHTQGDVDRVATRKSREINGRKRGNRVTHTTALSDQLGRNATPSEDEARLWFQRTANRSLDAIQGRLRPERKPGRRRPKQYGVVIAKSERLRPCLPCSCHLWSGVNPGQDPSQPSLSQQPVEGSSELRVRTPGDHAAMNPEQKVELFMSSHLWKMRTGHPHRADRGQICG